VCVLVYIVGVLVVIGRVLYVAMWRYHVLEFRERWKFLFIKFRNGAWWWGLAFLAKNFALHLSMVVMPLPLYQLYAVLFLNTIYLFATMLVWPYRVGICNFVDAFTTMSVMVNASFMACFSYADELAAERGTLGIMSAFVSWSPSVIGFASIIYMAVVGFMIDHGVGMGPELKARKLTALTSHAEKLRQSGMLLSALSHEETVVLYGHLNDYEVGCLDQVCKFLTAESMSVGGSRPSQLSGKFMVETFSQAQARANAEAEENEKLKLQATMFHRDV